MTTLCSADMPQDKLAVEKDAVTAIFKDFYAKRGLAYTDNLVKRYYELQPYFRSKYPYDDWDATLGRFINYGIYDEKLGCKRYPTMIERAPIYLEACFEHEAIRLARLNTPIANPPKPTEQIANNEIEMSNNICECGDESCTYSGEGGCDCVGRCNGRCVASNTYDDD